MSWFACTAATMPAPAGGGLGCPFAWPGTAVPQHNETDRPASARFSELNFVRFMIFLFSLLRENVLTPKMARVSGVASDLLFHPLVCAKELLMAHVELYVAPSTGGCRLDSARRWWAL